MQLFLVLAAVSATLLSGGVVYAADGGLVKRVGKAEETIFGESRQHQALPERINQLEKQTIGKSQSGPLSKRLEQVEHIVNGEAPAQASADVARAIPAHQNSKKPLKKTAQSYAARTGTGHGARSTAKQTATYLPPLAPSVDPGLNNPLPAPERAESTVAAKSAASVASASQDEVNDLIRRGTTAHQLGQTEQAEQIFKEVLVKSPFNSNACFNLGAIAEGRGDLAAALGNYRTALIGAPDDTQIQEAIAQIESQIASKQNSPFRNPLLPATAGDGTILRGEASEFDPLAPNRASAVQPAVQPVAQAPLEAPPAANAPARVSGWRKAGHLTGGFIGGAVSGAASGALRGAIRGGGNGALAGALSSGGRGAFRGIIRGATNSGMIGGNAGAVMNGLQCPLCRLLPF